jgi:hypothetical protein
MAAQLVRYAAALLVAGMSLVSPLGGAAVAAPSVSRACGSNLLTWFSPQGNGYAGGAGYVIEFSNIGTTACTVRGYPTVTLTENGRQVGLASRNDPSVPVRTVALLPGQTAHVVLLITDAGALCRPSPTNGLAVRAPGSAQPSHFSLVAFGGCPGRSTLRVDAINPGVGVPFYTVH